MIKRCRRSNSTAGMVSVKPGGESRSSCDTFVGVKDNSESDGDVKLFLGDLD